MSETGRCGDCRHWTSPGDRVDFGQLFSGDSADTTYGLCGLIDLAEAYEPPPDPLPLAVTKDGSDYRADLYTQAEFGCVLFQPRL